MTTHAQPLPRSRIAVSAVVRAALGAAIVAHGLGHAVYPHRGVGALGATALEPAAMTATWTVAVLSFVIAGLGLLGLRPWSRAWRPTAIVGVAASAALAVFAPMEDLWIGTEVTIVVVLVALLIADPVVRRHRVLEIAAAAFVGWVAVTAVTRPVLQTWGCDDECVARPLPFDGPARTPPLEINRVVNIAAPPEKVWPWLVQIGQDRAGFYSHSFFENLFLAQIENADEIHPEWQSLQEGGFVRAVPHGWPAGLTDWDLGWRVSRLEPGRGFVLETWGQFVVVPRADGGTDVHIRSTMDYDGKPVHEAALAFTFFDLPHAIMETGMLRGIRDRAERGQQVAVTSGRVAE